MADMYKINPLVLIGVPTLQREPISWEWSDAYASLQIPLGASHARYRVVGEIIAKARNLIAQHALDIGADWLLFISDDVIPPGNIFDMLARHKKKLVTGIYWTKSYPKQPYIWRDILRGPFVDWKYGEFFKVDWAGCDALLVHTDVLRAVSYPWFSHDWTFSENQPSISLPTEDLYFYTKARLAGFELWCDAACQCLHQDRSSKQMFGLDTTMPQHEAYVLARARTEDKLYIADIGCGIWTPYFENAVVKRFDINPNAHPDIVCDVRAIPEVDETFDMVYANHVLEHFYFWEAPEVLKEWTRILKVNGEIKLRVPNLKWAAQEILKACDNPDYDANYAWGGFYGTRRDVRATEPDSTQIHRCGYTARSLENLLRFVGCFGEIKVIESGLDGEASLTATARKIKSLKPLALLPKWAKIKEYMDAKANGCTEPPQAVVDNPLDLTMVAAAVPDLLLQGI
jgi:SAM-dependent methyltransferase